MTANELEELLEGAEETDALEFKGAMNWDEGIIKDILAMANIEDGGRIVIGIEDKTYSRQGMTEEQLASYNSDQIKDAVGLFADPFVEFTVNKVPDTAGLNYVVIAVAPFKLLPVICKKDGGKKNELRKGDVYYRGKTKRPCSERINNSSEMRDLLDRATVLRMRNFEALGLQAIPAQTYDFNEELEGL
ncbi:putative DNA-binding protein [Rhizobium sp. SJZ105]|uniref:AlbA family DNA-binding domain-containing protein n=1 Tax=Rhizobium sp. SJZ105 TaxID=2572678 RepID=UPI0011AD94F2|nr:ATP-binding protein [Rhizobium sp. SJZ105]TWC90147.1 putative DNA-binding protein [Rhizobium sp. SJZ105]